MRSSSFFTERQRFVHADRRGLFIRFCVLFLAYFLAGRIGLAVPFTSGNVSPVWPPAGIALAFMLLWGTSMWPAVWLGALLVNLLTPIPHLAAVGISVGNTLSALLAAWILQRRSQFDLSLSRARDVLVFVLVGTLSTAVAGTIGVSALNLTGVKAWSGFGAAWLIWCLGDAMGVIVLGPVALCLLQLKKVKKQDFPELFALIGLVTVVCFSVFDRRLGLGVADNVLVFLIFPFIIWAAMRFGVAGSALINLVVAGLAVWETARGLGPFVQPNAIRGASLLQVFLAVMSLSGLALAALVTEREAAEGALHSMKELVRLRERAEQALRTSEQRLSGIVSTAMDAIITVDESQKIILFNAAAERIFGCTAAEVIGTDIGRFIPQRFRQAHHDHVREFGATGKTRRSMYPPGMLYGIRSNGEEFPIEATISKAESDGLPLYTVILRDVTLRRQAEEALLKSEKLAAAGRLAATIAHEINNPLAGVTNLIYLVRLEESLPASAMRHLTMADSELKRVAQITKQTLGFYRDEVKPALFDPVELLESVLALMEAKLNAHHIKVDKDYGTHSQVMGFAGEIRQVFSNLISNAIEAVGEGGHLSIRISLSTDWRAQLARGVRVTIADNGHGIDPENRSRIFEPFFTTKKSSGTGLGLWVCRQIVDKHSGSIRVYSRAKADRSGSVFSVFLPINAVSKSRQIAATS